MRVELTNNNVKHLGRTMLFGDTLFLSLSGSGQKAQNRQYR